MRTVSSRPRGFTLIELLVVIAIMGILVAILLPAVQAAREAARKAHCRNTVKQLGLALHLYHDVNKQLPAGYLWYDDTIGPGWSWGSALLPYVENRPLYDEIDFQRHIYGFAGANDPNRRIAATPLPIFRCPSETGPDLVTVGFLSPYRSFPVAAQFPMPLPHTYLLFNMATTSYAGNKDIGINPHLDTGILFLNSHLSFAEIVDGLSNTLALGEVTVDDVPHASQWAGTPNQYSTGSLATTRAAPNTKPGLGNDRRIYGSRHPGGVFFAMCDGSVRFISNDIDSGDPRAVPYRPGIFQGLSTRSGGEAVGVE